MDASKQKIPTVEEWEAATKTAKEILLNAGGVLLCETTRTDGAPVFPQYGFDLSVMATCDKTTPK